jgi:hypothetical protein
MFWFFIPLGIVVLIVIVSVWIIAANVSRADRLRARSEEEKKSPNAPPA